MHTTYAANTGAAFSYDDKSFMMNGKRVFLNSAAIHYFRMPKEEWREVLVKAKLAGMNCIDTYFAWNVHEPNEGEWNFEGDADCGAFLDLCAELGLWVIARPGPFICAEWDFGGFPWWLGNKEGVKFREYNETYLKYVDLYFDRIAEIIRGRQLSQGGTVILVQVENEYGYLTDDASAAAYMSHLRDGLLNRGIDMPLITCVGGVDGAIEGANFWSGADHHYENLVKKQPDTPKIVTEFWSGWFEHWGAPAATQKTPQLYEKRMFEAIQTGFTGISHYMFFGGTNFAGYGGRTVGSSDIFMVTSYDYDAPLSEYGRTTPKYMAAKRFSLFAEAVGSLLLDSAAFDTAAIIAPKGITVRGRKNGEQRILFVGSDKEERDTVYLTLESGRTLPVMVNPGEIVPVLDGFQVQGGVRLTTNTAIACNEMVDGIHTVIVFAKDGQRSLVELNADEEIVHSDDQPLLYTRSGDGKTISFDFYHFNESQDVRVTIGDQTLRLVVMNTAAMDQTWRIAEGQWVGGCFDVDIEAGEQLVACLSESAVNGELPAGFNPVVSDDEVAGLRTGAVHQKAPALGDWVSSTLDLASVQGVSCEVPQDFSSFSQPYGYLVYSSQIESDSDQKTTLILPKLQDTARVYVNGTEVGLIREVGSSSIEISLRAGSNSLQILVQNMGRLNFSPYLGEPKGLFDTGYLQGNVVDLRSGWSHGEETVHLDRVNKLDGQVTLTRTFHLDGHDRAIIVGAVSKPLLVNGKEVPLEGYQNWFSHETVDISAFVQQGENVIEMPYMKSPVNRLELLSYHSSNGIGEWSMAGLEDGVPSEAGLELSGADKKVPTWYCCAFKKPELPAHVHAKLKLRLTGMSKGSVWLNGINLGRYWQIGPQEDYKIPLAWLKDVNELVLFDEEGRSPAKVKLLFDEQTSRSWVQLGSI
ncbi:glycosyl hydrolase family 35 [Paenibacillus cellulosilyticus]|uniref:Glycosyl hydrolase family 35 n=1 Tax=Paenibacillus cellulosilyticus TaxID=375489 RepID=A0A2V2YTH1_9BACL|nr:beta-galactosidase [Paenibacillus cellulosilyticus]PWV99549.1 glycosyl hydrolase family 35 [Paenibacillus cellulosilyticus]QKS44796.1 beta-galactosidase [Paenibacillus cellulosilyticus]